MPRITKPLTNTEVEKAKYKDKVFKLFDGQGLILKVAQTSKTWQFEYTRPYTKKRNMLSIGSYPSVTLAQARAKRDEYRALLAQNIDPMQYRDNAVKQATIDVNARKIINGTDRDKLVADYAVKFLDCLIAN